MSVFWFETLGVKGQPGGMEAGLAAANGVSIYLQAYIGLYCRYVDGGVLDWCFVVM